MTELDYAKHQPISLKDHPDFNEKWLQDRIVEDPTILGLGETILLDRERPSGTSWPARSPADQPRAGPTL